MGQAPPKRFSENFFSISAGVFKYVRHSLMVPSAMSQGISQIVHEEFPNRKKSRGISSLPSQIPQKVSAQFVSSYSLEMVLKVHLGAAVKT